MKTINLTLYSLILLILSCHTKTDVTPSNGSGGTGGSTDKKGNVVIYFNPAEVDSASIKIDQSDYSSKLSRISDCSSPSNSNSKIELNAGSHTLTADNGIVKWDLQFDLNQNECKAIKIDGTNTTGSARGVAEFDNGYESGMRDITLKVDGNVIGTMAETTQIIQGNNSPPPSQLIVPLTPGQHTYSAVSANGQQWAGTFGIKNGLTSFYVYLGRYNALPLQSGYCTITFFSPSNNPTTVNLNNVYIGKSISTYPVNTANWCVRKWVVSIVKPLGTYSYTSTNNNGQNSSGTVNANVDQGCIVVQLP